jgi:hypothetical protein
MTEHEVAPEMEAASDADATPAVRDNADSAALKEPDNRPCTHCLGKPEIPASTVQIIQKVEQKRSLEPAPVQAALPVMPTLAFIQPVLYRQGAPPGSNTPKHLLISLLLI